MERDLAQEIDALKEQVKQLTRHVSGMPSITGLSTAEGQERALALRQRAEEAGGKGAIEYYGAYEASGQGYLRTQEYLPVEDLLQLESEDVAKVIFAVANRQRLAMLKAILEEPRTANELVEQLSLGTTGQAYHHLKALQAADFVTQDNGGRYTFRPHRVHGFLMILAGAYDTLDRKYTTGKLDELTVS